MDEYVLVLQATSMVNTVMHDAIMQQVFYIPNIIRMY